MYLLGTKVGMTQVCDSQGAFRAVTVIHVGPCVVVGRRMASRHGYDALVLSYAGVASVVKSSRRPLVREVPVVDGVADGEQLTVASLGSSFVDVVGVSKGRGFAGVMKRHNFGGVCASHGVKKVHRSGGSTGQSTDPGRVFKGTKMPGRMGGSRVTVKSLRVAEVVADRDLLLVYGAVPGPAGGSLLVRGV